MQPASLPSQPAESVHERAFQAYLAAEPERQDEARLTCLNALERAGISLADFLGGLDDLILVRAIQRGCFVNEAFQALLVTRREERLQRYFVRHGLAGQDALDLVQQLYLKVYSWWKDANQFRVPPAADWQEAEVAFDRWLFAIAHNLLVDWFRNQHKSNRRLDEASGMGRDVDAKALSPQDQAIQKEEVARLHAAVAALPPLEGTLFRDYYVEGLNLRALASKNGLSLTSAWRLLRKAKKAVAAQVEGPGG